MSGRGAVVLVSGPCGAGKSSVVKELLRIDGVVWSASATTRRARPDEVDGREYRFVDKAAFEKMIADGEMLEHVEHFGEYYGTPRAPVEEALAEGRAVVMELEVRGARRVMDEYPEAVSIFIMPPDLDELRRRLEGRGTETPEAVERRLAIAEREMAESPNYRHVVVNDDLDAAAREAVDIVVRAKEAGFAARQDN